MTLEEMIHHQVNIKYQILLFREEIKKLIKQRDELEKLIKEKMKNEKDESISDN